MNYNNMRNMLDDVQTLLEFGDPQAQQSSDDAIIVKHTMMTMRAIQDAAVQAFPSNQPKPIDSAKLAKYIQSAKSGTSLTPGRFLLVSSADSNPQKVVVGCNIVADKEEGFALRVFVDGNFAGKYMYDDFAEYRIEDFAADLRHAHKTSNPNLPGKGQISFGAGLD